MQFSRYDIDWIFISHIRRKAFFSSYITGKTSYYNSSSRLIRVSIGLIDYLLAPPCFRQGSLSNACIYVQQTCVCCFLFLIWRPPALPHRLQCSTIGRLRLNRRVRDGNGCFPQAHRYQKCLFSYHTFVPVLTLSRIRYASSRWSQSFIYIFLCMSSIWYANIPSVIHPRNLCTHSLIAKQ